MAKLSSSTASTAANTTGRYSGLHPAITALIAIFSTVAAASAGGTFHVEFGGANVTGALTIPTTGGWQNWTTVSRTIALNAGQQAMRVVFDTGGVEAVGNVTWFRLTAAQSGGSKPYGGGGPWPLPGTLTAANFDDGGEGVAYHDTTAGNTGGQYRTTDVDIQASSEGGPPSAMPLAPATRSAPGISHSR